MTAITLRAARPEDCAAVWAWRFAPDVCARSGNPEPVARVDHDRWFASRLREWAPIWIIVDVTVEVGFVRIDARTPDPARISIALAGDARGRGLGPQAVRAACAAWAQPVVAEIRNDNMASRACFEACGFIAVAAPARTTQIVLYQWSP